MSGTLLALLPAVLTGCGDDDTTGAGATPPAGSEASCGYYDTEGCTLFGLVLANPMPTAEALSSLADLGGIPIAIWRTDAACIQRYSMPAGPYYGVASRFAYVDADRLRERILDAEGSVAPPITGLDGWNRMWGARLQEWEKAQEPGVLVEAVAVYLPSMMQSDLGQDPRFRTVTPLESYRTESTNPSYAGELLVGGAPALSKAPEITCE